MRLERRDGTALVVLAVLALLTRFWGLSDPNVVVWDEVHYLGFAGRYFSGLYYFDVHPPLGRLLLAGWASLLHVPGAALTGNEPVTELRTLPALFGALTIPAFYLLLRGLRATIGVAVLGAVMLLCDNSLLLMSRLILIDIFLVFFAIACVACFVWARHASGAMRLSLIGLSALFGGLAASTKWTGVSALGLVGLASLADFARGRTPWRRVAGEGALLAAVPAAVYVAAFAIHFALLPQAGPGSSYTPLTSPPAPPGATTGPPSTATFPEKLVETNRAMLATNERWAADWHVGASPWYTWPISKHSFAFWSDEHASGDRERWIILVGNPLVWWGALLGMLAVAGVAVTRRRAFGAQGGEVLMLAVAYLANFLPFALITRPMFLYHYQLALCFSVALAAVGVGAVWEGERARRVRWGVMAVFAISFAYFWPISTGAPLSHAAARHRFWILERHFWRTE